MSLLRNEHGFTQDTIKEEELSFNNTNPNTESSPKSYRYETLNKPITAPTQLNDPGSPLNLITPNVVKSPANLGSPESPSEFRFVSIKNNEGQNCIKLERDLNAGSSLQKEYTNSDPKHLSEVGDRLPPANKTPRSKTLYSEEIEKKLSQLEQKKIDLLKSYDRIDQLKGTLQKIPHTKDEERSVGSLPQRVELEARPNLEDNAQNHESYGNQDSTAKFENTLKLAHQQLRAEAENVSTPFEDTED